jgi:hypothetical protein
MRQGGASFRRVYARGAGARKRIETLSALQLPNADR